MTTPSSDSCDLSALEQLTMLDDRSISARELLAVHLERIDLVNGAVNALVDIRPDIAVAEASAIDAIRASGGDPGPLGGLVMGLKELSDVAGFRTTYGTPSRRDNMSTVDAHHVARLRAAGGVCIARTNSPELGAGSHTFNAVYGLTRNPWDLARSAGGSSGGSAVGLATGMLAVADGSDEGGSLRNPAAWAGVVGFRPTPGVVPRVGGNSWNPNATSGPMARTIDDLALLLGVMSQRDDGDPLWKEVDCGLPVSPLDDARVAWSRDLGGLPVESAISETVGASMRVVEALGWSIQEAEPDFSSADHIFETLRTFRRPGSLAPFLDAAETIKAVIINELHASRALTAHDVDKAYVALGQLRQKVLAFFDQYDILLAPVTQIDPFPVEFEHPTEVDGVAMSSYVEWMRSCSRVTSLGVPALSLPVGLSPAGLPVGLQVIGRPGADHQVLRAAKAIETALGPLPSVDLGPLAGVDSDPWVVAAAMH